MENYNLTAELKKIASGVTGSNPNTELGNINSGVGNLDTAMQGVATAINGLSIPNTGSNIDGVATAIGNISIPNPSTNIDGVATAITNKTIPDPSTGLSNIVTAINNLTLFSNKFYYEHSDNLSTTGTWGNYTNRYIYFDAPPSAIGAGKTFMLLHNVSWHNSAVDLNVASKIRLYGMNGTMYNELFNTRMFASGWPSITHISFVICDVNPHFEIGLSTNVAASGFYSTYILVPLN